MKKKKSLFLFLIALIVLMPFINVNAKDSLFEANDTINATGEKEGTVFYAGSTITTDAEVDGISLLAGNTINFNGKTEYAIYAGNMITINGSISKDAFIAGNMITLTKDAVLPRDVYVAGASVVINTNIGRNIYVSSGTIELDNTTIEGNFTIDASRIKFGDNVNIKGTLKYNKSAIVEGISEATYPNLSIYDNFDDISKEEIRRTNNIDKIIGLIGVLLVGIITIAIFPNLFKKVTKTNEKLNVNEVLKKLGLGFLMLFFLPVVAIMLFITVIGLSLGVISLIIYGLAIYYSIIIAGCVIGNLILTKLIKRKENAYLSLLIGVVLITIIKLIPFVGPFIGFISLLFGLGIILNLIISKKA